MLSRFTSTVEAFNDYECASRALRHILLCSVSGIYNGCHCNSFGWSTNSPVGLALADTQCAADLASMLLQ